jgi:hypothetical protein
MTRNRSFETHTSAGAAVTLAATLSACSNSLDAQIHAGAGSFVYAGSRAVGMTPVQSVGLCALAGLAKEAYDATGRGAVEARDVAATVLPCVALAALEHFILNRRAET